MSDRHSESSLSRRNVLKTAAAAGSLGVSPAIAGARSSDKATKVTERGSIDPKKSDRTQQISLRAQGEAEYTFSVSGILTVADAPQDSVSSGTASAALNNEVHKFNFTGEFVEFDTSGAIDVNVNGEPFNVDTFPAKSLDIVAPSGTDVDISASGRIEPVDADLSQPNPRRVTGTVTGRTSFRYSGELTYLEPKDDVKVFKQGQPVKNKEILPSNLPGKIEISGGKAEATVYTSDTAQVVQGSGARAVEGAITGSPTGRDVIARYDGNVETIEHENGAVVEVRESSKRVVCKAPDDSSAKFSVEASEGIALDRKNMSQANVTVEAGQSKAIKYWGRPSATTIDGLEISFNNEVYKDAVTSAKFQLAAEFERTDAYAAIAQKTESRIRHDAQGLRITSATGETARDMVFFQLTDIPNGDYGAVHLARLRESNQILSANYEIQQLARDGNPQKITVYNLENPVQGASFEVSTFNRGARANKNAVEGPEVDLFGGSKEKLTTQGFTIPDWVPDIPSPQDLLDAFGNALSEIASTIGDVTKETVSEIISGAINNAKDTTIDDFALKASTILIDSQEGLIELVAEAQNKLPKKPLSKLLLTLKPGFAGTLVTLGTSGAIGELADRNGGCGGCLAVVSLLIAVGIEGTAYATCTALGVAPIPIAGGVACGIIVGALLELGNTIVGPDAIDVCSGHSTPTEVDLC